MSSQLTLAAALDGVEANNLTWLEWARAMAVTCSHTWGSVCSDDIRRIADKTGYQPDSPHAWGAIFVGPGWTRVGRKASTVPANHCRWINVWRWDG